MAANLARSSESESPLSSFIGRHPRLLVLTGAGCSVASGIPEYRDHDGAWKSRPPVRYAEFVASAAVRRRYWARSVFGWERVAGAQPGAVHRALARLEQAGHARADMQALLLAWNGLFLAALGAAPGATAAARPDGEVQLEADFSDFRVPDCPSCGGVLKPAVVFFGENVPRARVDATLCALAAADALLVVGSSLMVFSGFRFCLAAREMGKPVAAVNLGRTRADELLSLKVASDCGPALEDVVDALGL